MAQLYQPEGIKIHLACTPQNMAYINANGAVRREDFGQCRWLPFHTQAESALAMAMLSPGGYADAMEGHPIWQVLVLSFEGEEFFEFVTKNEVAFKCDGRVMIHNDIPLTGNWRAAWLALQGPKYDVPLFQRILPMHFPMTSFRIYQGCGHQRDFVFGRGEGKRHCAECWSWLFKTQYKSFEDLAKLRGVLEDPMCDEE